jgi:NAD(P)-dependent dehydrogenase (short-subunit alcohol dehydrogenase family)
LFGAPAPAQRSTPASAPTAPDAKARKAPPGETERRSTGSTSSSTKSGTSPRSTPTARPAAHAAALNYGLAGRRIVVTGAAQGIGAACARLLVGQGAHVALWDTHLDLASTLAAELSNAGSGASCLALHCNVADKASVDAALAETLKILGGIDGVVSNAGIFRAAPFLDVSEADWDAVIATNLKGSFLVTQACARAMVAAGTAGAMVLMSSVNGVMAIPDIASYNASKGGIDQLTRAAALALADHAIRVNAVAPGTIATELAAAAVLTSEAARQRILGRTPMKRLGEPQEVAEVVAFLLSEGSRYMTGEIVYVDGGRRALNYSVKLDAA